MIVTCHACTNGLNSEGNVCFVCGGDSEINLTDAAFKEIKYSAFLMLRGQVWSDLLTNQVDILTKLDGVDTKFDALDTKLDGIETKIDALQGGFYGQHL